MTNVGDPGPGNVGDPGDPDPDPHPGSVPRSESDPRSGSDPDPRSEPFGTLSEDDGDEGDELSGLDDVAAESFDDDPEGGGDREAHSALPPKVEAWRRRSVTGAVLTGFALGLQQALGKELEQPAIVMQTSGDPPKDLPVEAEVEQGRPRQSVVNIRPWLLPDRGAATDSDPEDGGAAEDGPGTGKA